MSFRSRPGRDCWHFCENCPTWPWDSDAFETDDDPSRERWCKTCVRMYAVAGRIGTALRGRLSLPIAAGCLGSARPLLQILVSLRDPGIGLLRLGCQRLGIHPARRSAPVRGRASAR